MKTIIFNKDFNKEEILEKFKKFCEDEHEKRIIKKGKLFSVSGGIDHIDFGNINLLGSEADILYNDCFKGPNLYEKYKSTVAECIEILKTVCKEYGTTIKEQPTGGTAIEYVVIRNS